MLRKDVKLGFAIGGIMLAVVIVYVLVVPSGADKKTVGIVTEDPQSPGAVLPPPADTKIADVSDKPFVPPADNPKTDTALPATMPTTPSTVSKNTSGPDWNKLLNDGSSSPPMMSVTPTADTRKAANSSPDADNTQPPAEAASPVAAAPDKPATDAPVAPAVATPVSSAVADAAVPAADKGTADFAVDTATNPATQPADSSQHTHIVQPGEMLTSIAAAAYGDSRKWKHIAEANPTVNPNRLAPGTKLIIPVLKTSKESASSGAALAQIDPQTQYEVQENDSLYRISMKLYGKADHVDKLYQENKETIGSDPRRLKLHMLLKLVDPPTARTEAAAR